MSGYLLDTNAVLLLVLESETVGRRQRTALASGRRFVSQVCAIEIAIKHSLGKLPLPPPFHTDFAYAFTELSRDLSADLLPIDLAHVDALSRLPLHHRDPFDRLIIAQAIKEDLVVVTRDRAFARYPGLTVLSI